MIDQASGLRELVSKSDTKNSKFITIASGKGGVGKTNFAVNFSYILANEFKKRVLLIDADIGMANVHLFLGLDKGKNIKHLFTGEKIENIIQHAVGFDVLVGFSGIDDFFEMEDVSIQTVINQLELVSQKYDYIIIDTGAGIDEKVASFLRASHKSYVITTPEPTALMDAYALIKTLYNLYKYDNFKIVVNMCKNKEEGEQTFNKLKISTNKFLGIDIELLGVLPFTNNLRQAVKRKELVAVLYPKDGYTNSIRRICKEELKVESVTHDKFWQKLFDFMGKN
ncbi:flagellar biosynthesis protein FlhG [Nitratiruptor sp. YY08-26]|uniref:AAA family ATPase n=1 Tax=unclassified Nitratiruptor TaxID=2624044 RepID=UPI0019158277|nr:MULTISPECIES: AAA family ATPase [unclassified Nitratiruptor]BCD61856.1 flagellar biosynthesis protein FlhG [Nitratiruptor sp. YY08-13]BCD65791.1 flagellar biosynthesis protein FlhG [Nitratiruptor sp. YY08-26]